MDPLKEQGYYSRQHLLESLQNLILISMKYSGNSDRVVIDVGGRHFVTSKSTLISNSSYFSAIFSTEWSNDAESESCYFIDQDPDAFVVLLEFMRKGCIEVHKLNVNVLLLAEFLGLDALIQAIKSRAYRNFHGRDNLIDDDKYQDNNPSCNYWYKFDEEFGCCFKEAIALSILPQYLIEERKKNENKLVHNNLLKKFATLTLCINTADVIGGSFAAVINEEKVTSEKRLGEDCLSFLAETLTRLDHSRYSCVEKYDMVPQNKLSMNIKKMGSLIFSKNCSPNSSYLTKEPCICTTDGLLLDNSSCIFNYRERPIKVRKEFAVAQYERRSTTYSLLYAVAACVELEHENEVIVRRVWFRGPTAFTLNWLFSQSYVTRESKIESYVHDFLPEAEIFSRTIALGSYGELVDPNE